MQSFALNTKYNFLVFFDSSSLNNQILQYWNKTENGF